MATAPRVWITRTLPGAETTAASVREMGWEPVISPLLVTKPIVGAMARAPSPTCVTCLTLTSPNTILAIKPELKAYSHLPAYAVGDTTAQAALDAGLTDVTSAKGDIHALARLISEHQVSGTVFAPGAKEPAGDLVDLLPNHSVIRLPVYETLETVTPAPDDIAAILVHSPRAARILAARLNAQNASKIKIVTISNAATAPLSGLTVAKLLTSPTPDEEGVLRTLGNSASPV